MKVNAYENQEITKRGHIVKIKEYNPGRFFDSPFPLSKRFQGKLSFNFFYLIEDNVEGASNAFCEVIFDSEDKFFWELKKNNGQDLYDFNIDLNGGVEEFSFPRVGRFLENRFRDFDLIKLRNLNGGDEVLEALGRLEMEGRSKRIPGTKLFLRKSRDRFREARNVSLKFGLHYFEAHFAFLEGTAEEYLGNYAEAEMLLESASKEFCSMNNGTGWAQCMTSLGILYKHKFLDAARLLNSEMRQYYWNLAISKFREAALIQDKLRLFGDLSNSEKSVAHLLFLGGHQVDALSLINKAIKRLEDYGDTANLENFFDVRRFMMANSKWSMVDRTDHHNYQAPIQVYFIDK